MIKFMQLQAHKEAGDRIKQARAALRCCKLCPRQCAVDRTAGQGGFCGLDDSARCFREMVYYGEEEELTPSHQIYFTGCNLRCEFCTVAEWNEQPMSAPKTDFDTLCKKIELRRRNGAITLNLLGGEPSINLCGILQLLERVSPGTKVVWNSNMYYNDVVDDLMAGLIDIYVADLKCGNEKCADAMLGVGDYLKIVQKNIVSASRVSNVIVRHLVMPGHYECCLKPILSWLAEEIPAVKLSLRKNYVPPADAVHAPKRYIEEKDMKIAVDCAEKLGLNLIK